MNKSLVDQYHLAEGYFFTGISSNVLSIDTGANAYMTGAEGLNFIYMTDRPNSLDDILSKGECFYSKQNLSFDVIVPQDFCTPHLLDVFSSKGYVQQGCSVAMGIKLGALNLDKTHNLDSDISIRANNHQLNQWMVPLIEAFESSAEHSSIYADAHQSALQKGIHLHHFSLYKQDSPVASLTLSTHNFNARIDDLATLPQFQGKGYATLLMHHALSEAKRLGCSSCFLEASDAGLSLYQKLGFDTLFKNNTYSTRPNKK